MLWDVDWEVRDHHLPGEAEPGPEALLWLHKVLVRPLQEEAGSIMSHTASGISVMFQGDLSCQKKGKD